MAGLSWMLRDATCRVCSEYIENAAFDRETQAGLDPCPHCAASSDHQIPHLARPNLRPNRKGFKTKRYGPNHVAHSREEDEAIKRECRERLGYTHLEDDTRSHSQLKADANDKRHRAWAQRKKNGGEEFMKDRREEGTARRKERITKALKANQDPAKTPEAAA